MALGRVRGHPFRPPGRGLCAQFLSRVFVIAVLCALSVGLLKLVTLYDQKVNGGSASTTGSSSSSTTGSGASAAAGSQAAEAERAAVAARKESALRELWAVAASVGLGGSITDKQRDVGESLRLGLVIPEVISWHPRIFLLHNFLSIEECEALKGIARRTLEASTVVNGETGKSFKSDVRTSSGMFLTQSDSRRPLVKSIEDRIAAFSLVPPENGELIQILRYERGQHYLPHPDYFSDELNQKRGGQRVATVLMYIEAPESGGETIFPNAGSSATCECAGEMRPGLCVRPSKGDAVLFWSTDLEGKVDPLSLHGSCDVLKGEKWSATKWMRQNEFH